MNGCFFVCYFTERFTRALASAMVMMPSWLTSAAVGLKGVPRGRVPR